MKATPFGWGQRHFKRLYRGYGFIPEEGGNHVHYTHPDYPQLVASVGRHNKLAPGYAEDAVLIIEELLRLQQQ